MWKHVFNIYFSILFKFKIEHSLSKQSVMSDLGLRCLPLSHKNDAKCILVNGKNLIP